MDATIPWSRWAGLIEPFTCLGGRGWKPKALETMLRIYLLQAWFSVSVEGVEAAVYDSYAMRGFLGLDFMIEQVPDATTHLQFRHLLAKRERGKKLLESQGEMFGEQGWIMRAVRGVSSPVKDPPKSRVSGVAHGAGALRVQGRGGVNVVMLTNQTVTNALQGASRDRHGRRGMKADLFALRR